MSNTVIVFISKAGGGKDTAFNMINEIVPNKFKRIAFADKVKEVCRMIGWDGKKDFKGRRLLQDIGQSARAYNKDVWADIVINTIKDNPSSNFAVTDCRFKNELNLLTSNFNCITIKIEGRCKDLGENGNDISEHDLDNVSNYNYTINNNGSLDEFKHKLENILKEESLLWCTLLNQTMKNINF